MADNTTAGHNTWEEEKKWQLNQNIQKGVQADGTPISYDPNVDYSVEIGDLIANGAAAQQVYDAAVKRSAKIQNESGLGQYANDQTMQRAIQYLLDQGYPVEDWYGIGGDNMPQPPAGGIGGGIDSGAPAGYTPGKLAHETSAEGYINSLYAAQERAALGALKSAYDQNVLALDAAGWQLPLEYQAARNQTAASGALQRANFNEYAAASGLNSGAGGQARLAMSNTMQANLGGINRGEADAMAQLTLQRSSLETAYKNDIAQAIAAGDLAKAQALYGDFVRVDQSMAATSQAQADENYRAWQARYAMHEQDLNRQREDRALVEQRERETYDRRLMWVQILEACGGYEGLRALGISEETIAKIEAEQSYMNPDYKA